MATKIATIKNKKEAKRCLERLRPKKFEKSIIHKLYTLNKKD